MQGNRNGHNYLNVTGADPYRQGEIEYCYHLSNELGPTVSNRESRQSLSHSCLTSGHPSARSHSTGLMNLEILLS